MKMKNMKTITYGDEDDKDEGGDDGDNIGDSD